MNPENTLLVARAAIWRSLEKKQILIGQRPAGSKNYPNMWEFPGGKIDLGEDPSFAALREAREEAKITAIRYFQPEPLTREYIMPKVEGIEDERQSPYVGWLIKTWVVETLAFMPQTLTTSPQEHQQLRWVSLEEAQDLPLMPQTDFALPYLRTRQNVLRSLLGLDPLPPIKLG